MSRWIRLEESLPKASPGAAVKISGARLSGEENLRDLEPRDPLQVFGQFFEEMQDRPHG